MFVVNQDAIDKAKAEKPSNIVLDAVDDFSDFIKEVNESSQAYV